MVALGRQRGPLGLSRWCCGGEQSVRGAAGPRDPELEGAVGSSKRQTFNRHGSHSEPEVLRRKA